VHNDNGVEKLRTETGALEKRKLNREARVYESKKLSAYIAYVDENGIGRYMSRNWGRAPREKRVIVKRPGRQFKRLNVVAGQIGAEVIAPYYYDWTTTALWFKVWFEWYSCPVLSYKTYIIMDNARFHRGGGQARIFCVIVIFQWTEKQHKDHDLPHKSEVGICPCLPFSRRAAKVCAAAAVNAFAARRESFVWGKLPGGPVAKQDVQLANDLIPISTTGSPVFGREACPWGTIFVDARYSILRRESSLVSGEP